MTQDSRGASRRPLYIAVGVVAVLVVVALIVVFTRSGPVELDESTPEGVVQRYVEAIIAGDDETARGYLTPDLREQCDDIEPYERDNTRVTLAGTTERGDTATVEVMVTRTAGAGLGATDYTSEERFQLERDGGDWVIDGTPWQFSICTETAR